jgi:hypothetical protein
LRMDPQASINAIWHAGSPGDSASPGSAPAAAQWVHCAHGSAAGADSSSYVPCSGAGGLGGRTGGSTRPSGSSSPRPGPCSSGCILSAAGGAAVAAETPVAAQALMMARGSSAQDAAATGSPTAGLSQRMRTLLAVQVPTQASGKQAPDRASAAEAAAAAAAGQHQGAQLLLTDDIMGHPIMQMLLHQPLAELPPTAGQQQRQPGALSASGEAQFSVTGKAAPRQAGAGSGSSRSSPPLPPRALSAVGAAAPAAVGEPQLNSIEDMLRLITMAPQTDAEMATWQQQVYAIMTRLHHDPAQRLELATLSMQQGLSMAQAKTGNGSTGQPPVSAGGSVRPHSSKQRPGPSRLSCSGQAVDATGPPVPLPPGPAAPPVSMAPLALKRSQPAFHSGLGGREPEGAASPLKRARTPPAAQHFVPQEPTSYVALLGPAGPSAESLAWARSRP